MGPLLQTKRLCILVFQLECYLLHILKIGRFSMKFLTKKHGNVWKMNTKKLPSRTFHRGLS